MNKSAALTPFLQEKVSNWEAFASLAEAFGFKVRPSGGAFEHTHVIDGTTQDLQALIELAAHTS